MKARTAPSKTNAPTAVAEQTAMICLWNKKCFSKTIWRFSIQDDLSEAQRIFCVHQRLYLC
jgi:hypothetical protein